MSAPRLPFHPRLAEHALVRRHVIDGAELVVIHDTRTGDLVRMDTRAWALLAPADGTRDRDGLVLAAAKSGALRRASEIGALLEQLQAAGLLADGIEHADPPPAIVDRPLSVLPDFSLTCDASGACCGVYGSILFTPLEAARARSVLPLVRGGGEREDRVFTPEQGTGEAARLAVALVDNCCAYLGGDGRCGLHAAAGADAKPAACSIYPATFVDDGETIRVSLGVECPCALDSVGKDGGAPLVAPDARTRADSAAGRARGRAARAPRRPRRRRGPARRVRALVEPPRVAAAARGSRRRALVARGRGPSRRPRRVGPARRARRHPRRPTSTLCSPGSRRCRSAPTRAWAAPRPGGASAIDRSSRAAPSLPPRPRSSIRARSPRRSRPHRWIPRGRPSTCARCSTATSSPGASRSKARSAIARCASSWPERWARSPPTRGARSRSSRR